MSIFEGRWAAMSEGTGAAEEQFVLDPKSSTIKSVAHRDKSLDIAKGKEAGLLRLRKTDGGPSQYFKYRRDYFISKEGWVMDIDMDGVSDKVPGKKSVRATEKSSSATQQWDVQYLDEIGQSKAGRRGKEKPVEKPARKGKDVKERKDVEDILNRKLGPEKSPPTRSPDAEVGPKGKQSDADLEAEFGLKPGVEFFVVSGMNGGRYLDIADNKMVINAPNGKESQKWIFSPESKTVNSIKYPEMSWHVENEGCCTHHLKIWATNSHWFQLFKYQDGKFVNPQTKKVLDVW